MSDIDAIRERHVVEDPQDPHCLECGGDWPCDTAQVLAALAECEDEYESAVASIAYVRRERDAAREEVSSIAYVRRQRDAARALADELAEALDREVAASGCKPDCPSRVALAKWEASK